MRNLIQKILITGGILLSIFAFHNAAKACSCSESQTVEKEFARYPNVAILKLQSVKQIEGEPANYSLSVERVFKGELKVGETLNFTPGFACSWYFREEDLETEFLLYLDKKTTDERFWTAGICSRSRRLKAATADLLYLEKEKRLRGKTRLSGTLDQMLETPENVERYSFFPLANRKVRIVGRDKNVELVTDENGVYEVYDLPPGKYKIFPEKLDGFIFSSFGEKYTEVEIKPKNHTEENFYYEIDNAVSGKVMDATGRPLENVCLDLIPSKPEKATDYSKGRCTDKTGKFEITSIPVGNYKLVINKEGKITLKEPFGTFYYPNVKTREEASEIAVGANYFLRDLIIVPPAIVETVTLSGRLIFADGKPAVDETVQILKGAEISESAAGIAISDFEVKTDKNGRFSIKTLKGHTGILRGIMYSFLGEYENCPEIDEILKSKGDKVQPLETDKLEFSATENLREIELKFPFKSCKEAK